VVLALGIGWILETYAGVRQAMVLALFVGLIGAPLVPLGGRSGCSTGEPRSRT
jgi:hypothetical protein